MKILADESVDKEIVDRLRANGHDVAFIAETSPGITDIAVLHPAQQDDSLLITGDKDFGELVYRHGMPHSGVLLIRMRGATDIEKAERVALVVAAHGMELAGCFSVVSKGALRVRSSGG